MREGLLVAACLSLCMFAAPASPADWEACNALKNPSRASEACGKIVDAAQSSDVDRARALDQRAAAAQNNGDNDRAIADLDKAIEINAGDGFAYSLRGDAYRSKRDERKALADYRAAMRLIPAGDPLYARALAAIVALQASLAAPPRALSAPAPEGERAAALLRGAAADYGKGDFDGAIAQLNDAIRLKPDFADALSKRGFAYYAKGDFDRAIGDLSEVIRLRPGDFVALQERGAAYARKSDYDHAIADADEALRLKPDFVSALDWRGFAFIERRDFDRAIADYTEAIRLKPDNPVFFTNRGNAYLGKGDADRAIADYSVAIRIKPDAVGALAARGRAYDRKGDHDRAIADYGEAIRLKPDHAVALTDRGDAYNRKGDYGRAIADFDEAIRLNPGGAGAFNGRGYAYNEKGDYDRALADLNEAIALKPDYPFPFKNRGYSYIGKRDYDRAIDEFNKALELKDESGGETTLHGEALAGRGDAFQAKGDAQRALADYQAAARLMAAIDPLSQKTAAKIAALLKTAAPQPDDAAQLRLIEADRAATTAAPPRADPGRRVALVIGNAAYKNAALTNPAFDADLVSASLRKMGFEVTEVKNADFAGLDAALTQFVAKEDRPDIVLFYFAGHGFAMSDGLRPRNYLMSTSADLASTSEALLRRDGVTLDDVIDRISAPAKITLAFVDACRNDPFHRGAGDRGFERVDIPLQRQLYIGMSTQLGKTALDGDEGKGSPFAQAFVKVMATPGLRIDDAFRQLREEVAQKTEGKQRPEILQDDLQRGAFVLVGAQ